ncbi:hypothetical protein ACFONG_01660 [Uliginosibacterium paludis]|uniref:Uncharacterized protein n=1 Tax=Uliginosibacterium paludis TaxID=1615952 RepID=A0ABV2CSX1_9RHOO
MKAALVCLVLLTLFVLFSWYFIVPYLGFLLLAMPAMITILGAREIWRALRPQLASAPRPQTLRPQH